MLAELLRRWEAVGGRSGALTPAQLADLAASAVRITPGAEGAGWVLAHSGAAVNTIYGAVLDGLSADVLTPGRNDVATEAAAAVASGRPMLIEDSGPDGRLMRLYLPLSEADGSRVSALCAVVAVRTV